MLITFEGMDGAGKSTQIKYAAEFLSKKNALVQNTREPGFKSELSDLIRHLIVGDKTSAQEKLFLFLADRNAHYKKLIMPFLRTKFPGYSRNVIICDRGPDSTVAYQGFGAEVAPIPWIVEANKIAMEGARIDLTILLDLPVEVSLRRAKDPQCFERLGPEFFHKVRQGFHVIAKEEPNRVVIVDSTKPKEEVAHTIERLISDRLLR